MQSLPLLVWLLAVFYSYPSAARPAGNGRASSAPAPHSLRPAQAPSRPPLRFADFKASNFYVGKPAKIDYKSHPIARQYRTVITEGYKEEGKANFGGHYRFITWGCGSSCAEFALVDLRTGRVYNGMIAPAGFDFEANSQLVIVNPPADARTALYELETQYWVWNEARHKFEQRFPRP